MPLTTYVVLKEAGFGAVLEAGADQLPALLHWGADLGDLTRSDVAAMARASLPTVGPNQADVPLRMSLLPDLSAGYLGRPGLSGSRGGRAWTPHFATVAVKVDGVPVEAGFVECGPALVEIDCEDAAAALALTLRVELLVGGVLRVQARLTNGADDPYQLDQLVLALPVPAVADELLDFAGRWGTERAPQRRPFTVGTHLRENRRGRTGADSALLMHAGTRGFSFSSGEVWAVHTAWSGNHVHYAERLSSGEQVIGGGELLLPGEVVLAAGEGYTSPWLYATHGIGLDQVARRFHSYLRSRPAHPSADRPVTLNVWEAVYFDHRLEPLLELAEAAASAGVERYVLDDGWFGARRDDHAGLGDWTVSRDVWPDGLHPLIDRVTELGMQFGLWFEPEMVNPDSDVARAHPEWVMAPLADRWPIESRFQQVLNLGIPECYAYIRDAMSAILDEYAISYIKWDHNRDLIEAATQASGRPGVHEQTLAFYRLLDELKAAHPGLEIESCSSGGARVDLEVLQRTERVWVSDCIDPHERQRMHRWTTQLIPPEMMGSHIASQHSHTTGRRHDLSFRAATAIFGHLGIEWDLRRATPAERAELGDWVAFYKEHRGLLNRGDLVRLDLPDASVMATGVVAHDKSRAIFSFASVARSDVATQGRLRFPGLDAATRYRVTPVLVGPPQSGLRPPLWWGLERDLRDELENLAHGVRPRLRPAGELGVELTGRVLAEVGLMDAPVDPDQAVLYLVEAVRPEPESTGSVRR